MPIAECGMTRKGSEASLKMQNLRFEISEKKEWDVPLCAGIGRNGSEKAGWRLARGARPLEIRNAEFGVRNV
jgi:hypothetical protein